MADDFSGWLVIDKYARRPLADLALNQLAVDANLVGWQDTLTNVSRLTIDRNAPCDDQFLHVAARSQTSLRQHLVQLWRIIFCGQVTADGLRGRWPPFASPLGVCCDIERSGGNQCKDVLGATGFSLRLGLARTISFSPALLRLLALAGSSIPWTILAPARIGMAPRTLTLFAVASGRRSAGIAGGWSSSGSDVSANVFGSLTLLRRASPSQAAWPSNAPLHCFFLTFLTLDITRAFGRGGCP